MKTNLFSKFDAILGSCYC